MECREVQKRLSAYVEKVVSPKQKALIDGHLKTCKKCKVSLADLKKAIEYVQRLEEVEPPAWLAQKVMARVRSEAEAKRVIWQRFFRPFHIKIPLEAIALIFIAVGAIYIFKAMQPEMQLAKAPIEQKAMAPGPSTPEKEKPPAVKKEQPAPARAREELMYEKRVETREERRSTAAPQAPAALTKQEGGASPLGFAEHATVNRDVASSLQGVSPKAAAEMKADGLRFVVKVGDIEIASRDIEGIVRQLGGRAITTEPLKDKAVIAAVLDSQKMQELFDRLHLIGEVQKKGSPVKAGEGAVGIRIDILKTPTSR